MLPEVRANGSKILLDFANLFFTAGLDNDGLFRVLIVLDAYLDLHSNLDGEEEPLHITTEGCLTHRLAKVVWVNDGGRPIYKWIIRAWRRKTTAISSRAGMSKYSLEKFAIDQTVADTNAVGCRFLHLLNAFLGIKICDFLLQS